MSIDSLQDLPDLERRAIAEVWRSRASAEGSVHAYALSIVSDLRAIDADPAVVALAARMVSDEARHVDICVEVANRYAPGPIAAPSPRRFVDPLANVPMPLRATLRAVAVGCIGESFACAWVDRSAHATRPAFLRETLRHHLADEIHHARVGWAHLASSRVGALERSEVARWLPQLVEANLASWRTFDPRWPSEGFPEHGLPSHADSARWIEDALHTLVLPGLEHLGIDVSACRPAANPV